MSQPTAIIAEDEPLLRAELKESLAALWPQLRVVHEAQDGLEAMRALSEHGPDVVFLDIAMPGASGLEVARAASGRAHVVFVTAYDQHAVAAFERGAVDYVMKPFSVERLELTVARLKDRLSSTPAHLDEVLAALAARAAPPRKYLRWISVAQGRTIKLITVDQICYFRADNKYTLVATADAQSLINTTIRELTGQLDPEVFLQVHRGTLVNVNAIAAIHRDLHGRLELSFKGRSDRLAVSASYAHLFRHF